MRLRKLNKFVASLGTAVLLSGCATLFVADKPEPLPELPPELVNCFMSTYEMPDEETWDTELTTEVIGSLRKSELKKTSCGRRIIAFYNDLRIDLSD